MKPKQVGFSGRIKIKDDITLLIRRMESHQKSIYLERNNNMLLWCFDSEELYYQSPTGEKFLVVFEPLKGGENL